MAVPFSRTTRSLRHDTAAAPLWAWGIAAGALLAWGLWFCFGRVTVFEVSRHARIEVVQAAHPVAGALAGRVLVNRLTLDMTVQAGQVLVELDDRQDTLRLREEEARAQGVAAQAAAVRSEISARSEALAGDHEAAVAAVQAAQARSREAAVATAFANDQDRRLRAESEAGSVALIDALRSGADAHRLAATEDALAADARRAEADGRTRGAQQRAQIDGLRRTLATLDAETASSAASIARLMLAIDSHRVRAPVAGRIGDMLPLRAGDVVAAGQRFASVIPQGGWVIVAAFEPAAVIGRVHAGQPAQLRLDGFPWAQFGTVHATVTRVASEIQDKQVRVELTPQPPWPAGLTLQHGLPGAVEIRIGQLAPAQLVLRASGQLLAFGDTAPSAPSAPSVK